MASFIKNMTKMVGEAAQTAAKKSGDMVEIVKLKRDISGEEEKIEKSCLEIGQKVYQTYVEDIDAYPEFHDIFLKIKEYEQKISNLRQAIEEISEQKDAPAENPTSKFCSGCGNGVEAEAKFCPKCGAKLA